MENCVNLSTMAFPTLQLQMGTAFPVVHDELLSEFANFAQWDLNILQKIAGQPFTSDCEKIVRPSLLLDRVGYVSKAGSFRIGEHWGQLKLLLSEIEFLSDRYLKVRGKERVTVVYVGSAPGLHIPFLVKLFEHKVDRWILIDPAKFSPDLARISNVETHREFFSDETARQLKSRFRGERVMFVSDIRRNSRSETEILEDMESQARWVQIMKPYRSMLKFRLPYVAEGWAPDDGSPIVVSYFRGKVVTQAFAPTSSTEARLITNLKLETKDYDSETHEKQMAVFNLVHRSFVGWVHPIQPWRRSASRGATVPPPETWDLNYSYDTFRMLTILIEYVRDRGLAKSLDVFDPEREFSDEIAVSPKLLRLERVKRVGVSGAEWKAAGAFALACMHAIICRSSSKNKVGRKCHRLEAKRAASPDGVLVDQKRAARFRRKSKLDLEAVKSLVS